MKPSQALQLNQQEWNASRRLPYRAVSRATFIKRMVKSGASAETARFTANVCIGLGSHVLVGQEWLSITAAKKRRGASEVKR